VADEMSDADAMRLLVERMRSDGVFSYPSAQRTVARVMAQEDDTSMVDDKRVHAEALAALERHEREQEISEGVIDTAITVSGYWRELKRCGVPDAFAESLTTDFQAVYVATNMTLNHWDDEEGE
jgi:hypothetical protein